MSLGYYDRIKNYLHPHLNQFVNYYRNGNIIALPPYHGSNRLNRNGARKEIEYNLGHQSIIPTYKPYWRETKNKYKRLHFYQTRYMTKTNCRYLFKNKGNFVFNYKPKKYEHLSGTPMSYNFYHLQEIKKRKLKNALK